VTRSQLVRRLFCRYKEDRQQAPVDIKDIERGVKTILEQVSSSLSNGRRVEIRGFGSFFVHTLGARTGRNPKTGDPVSLPVRCVPRFRPGKALREGVNSCR